MFRKNFKIKKKGGGNLPPTQPKPATGNYVEPIRTELETQFNQLAGKDGGIGR
jgi:hypothetical protein